MPSIQVVSIDDPRLTPPIRHEWQDDALCAEVEPSIFFPGKGGTTLDAKSICMQCDVLFQCLAYAMEREQGVGDGASRRHGIFGGLGERERKRLNSIMKKKPSLTLEEAYKVVTTTKPPKRAKKPQKPSSQELQAL